MALRYALHRPRQEREAPSLVCIRRYVSHLEGPHLYPYIRCGCPGDQSQEIAPAPALAIVSLGLSGSTHRIRKHRLRSSYLSSVHLPDLLGATHPSDHYAVWFVAKSGQRRKDLKEKYKSLRKKKGALRSEPGSTGLFLDHRVRSEGRLKG
ncbi:unnamed protein product [Cyclocybe aegerita]|uniref:Uncharacterized protein n=1 Tax=Cyclocybe aegerita TaxID=1973307 RepID=A0A8S0VQB6_CYCAE|nr:unnamed protein product [Cyclocybe aegerita]